MFARSALCGKLNARSGHDLDAGSEPVGEDEDGNIPLGPIFGLEFHEVAEGDVGLQRGDEIVDLRPGGIDLVAGIGRPLAGIVGDLPLAVAGGPDLPELGEFLADTPLEMEIVAFKIKDKAAAKRNSSLSLASLVVPTPLLENGSMLTPSPATNHISASSKWHKETPLVYVKQSPGASAPRRPPRTGR